MLEFFNRRQLHTFHTMRQIPLRCLTALTLVTLQIQSEWWTDPRTRKQYIDVKTKGHRVPGNQKPCIDLGAVLPEPRSCFESEFLARQPTSAPFRLGLRWNGAVWKWDSDSTVVSWTNWHSSRVPNVHRCVVTGIKEDNYSHGEWELVNCYGEKGISSVVCEKGPTQGNVKATTEQSVTQGGANAPTGQSSHCDENTDDPSDDESSFFDSDAAIAIGAVVGVVGTVSATVGILSMFTNVFQTAQPAIQPDTTTTVQTKDVVQDNADGVNTLSDLAKHDSSSSSSEDEGIRSTGNNAKSTLRVDTASKSSSESSSSSS